MGRYSAIGLLGLYSTGPTAHVAMWRMRRAVWKCSLAITSIPTTSAYAAPYTATIISALLSEPKHSRCGPFAYPSVGRCVCVSVQKVYCGKTADWIWMLFEMVSGVGRGMGVINRGGDIVTVVAGCLTCGCAAVFQYWCGCLASTGFARWRHRSTRIDRQVNCRCDPSPWSRDRALGRSLPASYTLSHESSSSSTIV